MRELEQNWRSLMEVTGEPTVCVDLTGVTYIDAAGRARLAEMHQRGAQFIAGDCVTKAVVAEIVGERSTVESKGTQDDSAAWQSNTQKQREAGGA